jgi:hypothetical protein
MIIDLKQILQHCHHIQLKNFSFKVHFDKFG